MDQLERLLARHDSATAALGEWCETRHIAKPAVITARRLTDEVLPPSDAVRKALQADDNEPIGYRHVRLDCGHATLSIAHNWYLADRLTPDMNKVLDTSDIPFGKVAAPLRFTRERLASEHGPLEGCPAATVLSQRALLRLPDGRPLAYLIECYTEATLSGRSFPR